VSGDADSLSVNAGLCGVSTNSCSVKIAAFDRVMALDRVVIGEVVCSPRWGGLNAPSISASADKLSVNVQVVSVNAK